MSHTLSTRLNAALDRWETLRNAGKDADLLQLCGGDVELLGRLQEVISKLERLNQFFEPETKKHLKYAPPPAPDADGGNVPSPLRFADRYQMNRQLGQGGFGQVWSAYDTLLK